jgi:predicted ATPase
MVSRYVLTGAPGAGKTVLLHALAGGGQAVVEEAATEVIATLQGHGVDEPWMCNDFCDQIVALQRQRQVAPVPLGAAVQIFDRSPLCTLALARYLGRSVTPLIAEEVARVVAERVYQPTVFLVRSLGFIEPTAARRITYPDALAFEAVHEAVYREHGYEFVDVPAAPIAERVEIVRSVLARHQPDSPAPRR